LAVDRGDCLKTTFFSYRPDYAYEDALALQGVLNSENYQGLLAFEPPETIILGRASEGSSDITASHEFLATRGVHLLSTDRPGRAAYHGPGQLVGFPIVNLKKLYGDPKAVKRFSEELLLGLAHACATLGVKSVSTRPDFPGLWTSRGLLASVGITVKDGFVFHGFSLHLNQNCLPGFGLIKPFGMENCAISTMEQEGVKISCAKEFALKLLPYLSVIQGDQVYQSLQTRSFESKYSSLVAAVSRSPMAIDHFRSNMESVKEN